MRDIRCEDYTGEREKGAGWKWKGKLLDTSTRRSEDNFPVFSCLAFSESDPKRELTGKPAEIDPFLQETLVNAYSTSRVLIAKFASNGKL